MENIDFKLTTNAGFKQMWLTKITSFGSHNINNNYTVVKATQITQRYFSPWKLSSLNVFGNTFQISSVDDDYIQLH